MTWKGPCQPPVSLARLQVPALMGTQKLCGPMLGRHCGSTVDTFSTLAAKQMDDMVIFAIAFGAFFSVGVPYDQIVLSRYFG